ncbi:MAG: transcription elongation factor GreA [Ruminococcus sp.]|nr:transcription elongation factor GreA [Oscillospiraceae bacterium]MBR2724663.1 transcription elongation factor GreA [Ruminococcus sp.]
MAKSVMLTTEGYQKLVEELEYLTGEKKMEVAEKIKVARSFGDLSENSEYEDAKNEQGILEARIATIEATLKVAVVIDETNISTETVHVGSVVRLENLKLSKEVTYMITGSSEANPKEAKLSDESPVGKALIGHGVGDVVEVETPSGIIGFKILEISKK